jgi:hypothetical protein
MSKTPRTNAYGSEPWLLGEDGEIDFVAELGKASVLMGQIELELSEANELLRVARLALEAIKGSEEPLSAQMKCHAALAMIMHRKENV